MADKKTRKSAVDLNDQIEPLITSFRGEKVIMDSDLALLYGVATKALNQAVKRNTARFPGDFVFQLKPEEFAILKSQSLTSTAHGELASPLCVLRASVFQNSSIKSQSRWKSMK